MKLAAVDLGSNSFHAVVVEVCASGGFEVIDRAKDVVRIGSDTAVSGRLSAARMERGLEVLHNYKRLADNHGVDRVLAVATSAIREARNGEPFLDRVGREVGFRPRAISGEEEGRLVYLAALHSVHLDGRALVLDVGGGSVELVLGCGSRIERTVSERLGSLRMARLFVHSDPLSAMDEARLVAHVEATLGGAALELRRAGFERLVGTSGTILSLGALALGQSTRRPSAGVHHTPVPRDAIRELRRRLVASSLKERSRMPGLDLQRADTIVAGAIVVDEILERTGARELLLCEWALREGLLLDTIHGHPHRLARARAYADVRRHSVQQLAERCHLEQAHARHVSRLSLQVFDALAAVHGLGGEERCLLESAALLHDVGCQISYPGHHKHSYYLIKNGNIRGFTPLEIEMMALVARYHRRARPRKRHAAFGALPKTARRTVRLLAGIVRIVEALDRSHRQVVRTVDVLERGGGLLLRCAAEGDSDLERWGVSRQTGLLARALGRPVAVEIVTRQVETRLGAA